ncbi:unnamed protein product [Rotaria sp. Silwood2]|nr:unnamed protein product [Rotaria sp. Silwood2]CAF2485633.1 unnamed protein product [Rotaria sp. Silwood2]CAF2717208.1 unnamed protein product [Rotaria sp. Silwood2]CAF2869030.1 unnamed protein product [Rotaria sp. Silwood2]CAF4039271.1 unnamed protein product [Rotaria sp. Silwood2]
MSETGSFSQSVRTISVGSETSSTNEILSVSTSPPSSSFFASWGVQYKTIRDPKSKGIWDGYETQEDFMAMHIR